MEYVKNVMLSLFIRRSLSNNVFILLVCLAQINCFWYASSRLFFEKNKTFICMLGAMKI
jgi:hypothetical protein